jgi:hypothetical protein
MSLKGNLKRVEKSYVADLENILRDIAQKYEIHDKNTNHKIREDDLINIYILPLIEQEKQYQCSAILMNGNRCSHKSLKETKYKYCKKHLFKDTQNIKSKNYSEQHHLEYNDQQDVIDVNFNINYSNDIIEKNNDIDTTQLIKHFIDNKLYYIDDKYIYDSDGISKAGYLEYDDSDVNVVNYILIDDPFILQNL